MATVWFSRDPGPRVAPPLTDDGESAARVAVRFGMGTPRHVEVVDGLAEGDTIIVGSTTGFDEEERIEIR